MRDCILLWASEDDYLERVKWQACRKKNVITLREIIKIKLSSSVVMESKQQAVRFAAKHEIRCRVGLHSRTELTLSRIA